VTAPAGTGERAGPWRSRRLVVALVGLGVLLTAAPVVAAPSRVSSSEQAGALRLLEEAARASRGLSYSGTKFVAAWRAEGTSSALVEVRHDPRRGMVVTGSPTADRSRDDDGLVLAVAGLDRDLLRVLDAAYDLRIAGQGRCTGRDADVVEALRSPDGSLAGRFWIDRESRLLLRREVYDEAGRRVRSSAFVDLTMTAASPVVAASSVRPLLRHAGDPVTAPRLARLRAEGWHLPAELPGGFALFDARSRAHDPDGHEGRLSGQVLHLAYSDGLSTTSLFVQRGALGSEPPDGFLGRDVAGFPVWAHAGAPERVVWAGGGQVWTLVSDAPESTVAQAVATLPHDALPDTGLRARFARGVSRLGSWLNPFT
jgi:negative regulator of sigma E activity